VIWSQYVWNIRQRPHSLRHVADRLIDKAEEGDLPSIREFVDRLDGKATQAIECGDVSIERLTDAQLYAIAAVECPTRLHDEGAAVSTKYPPTNRPCTRP
jgi:hypothetical protein